MNRKKALLALLACIVLFAGAVVFALTVPGHGGSNDISTQPVIISEILAGNRTYIAPNGQYLDYVEIRNTTSSPVDISGYMISDRPDFIGYTFPNGTILPANSYIVCWCDKESDSDRYGRFGISRKGEDTILLYNHANVLVDQCAVPAMEANVPLVRSEDGSWATAVYATPGFPNTDDGFDLWLKEVGAESVSVVISEVMPGSGFAIVDGDGSQSDWVELLNTGKKAVSLDGAFLSDDPANRAKWQITGLTIEPGERVLIRCAGAAAKSGEADFALSRNGCSVILTGKHGNTIDMVDCPDIGKECSWALQDDGSYIQTPKTTPGYENTDAGYDTWLNTVGYAAPDIRISEVMSANRSTLQNRDGILCDWIELYNAGSDHVALSGLYLSNDIADRMKWTLPDITLGAGEYVVIPCSGSGSAADEADFSLPREGCTVVLSGSVGNVIDQVNVPRLGEDRSWALQSGGIFSESSYPSPGYVNSQEGAQAFRETQTVTGPLIISEVMPSNCSYLMQSDGEYYDWVELKNISEDPIDLARYSLSDDPSDLDKFPLPDTTLEAGESILIICSGNTELTSRKYIHAPFTLSREESWVYLSLLSERGCRDYIRIFDVPYQHSVGRVDGENGTYYFERPTPGADNGSGVAFISETPVVVTKDGVYNDVASVTVELNGSGPLYYTLDGSTPTEKSKRYTAPLVLKSTTAVRVACIEEGKLPSDVVTATYIINENHTLPVVSLVAEPSTLFGRNGIYTNYNWDKEVRCNLKLFETDGNSFTIDGGVKMHGHTGLKSDKKSFKVNFRGRYGQDILTYPVYGEDGPDVYDSLIIRAGQDYPFSIFRDELFTSLARDISPEMLAQRDKFSILYVNGQYYGIYCIKEAWTELMYAQNMGGSPDNVEIVQAPVEDTHEIYALTRFCRSNDMTNDSNYAYVASVVDIDNLIDYMMIQGYCTNGDVQQNLRYIRSKDTGNKWQLAFYDVDWAFYYHNYFKHVLSPHQAWQHLSITRAVMKHPEFREKFLARCSELMATTLSNENVIARIDYYENLLDPEVKRERKRWGGSYAAWKIEVQTLRDFVLEGEDGYDTPNLMINKLVDYIGLTDAEIDKYFSRWR